MTIKDIYLRRCKNYINEGYYGNHNLQSTLYNDANVTIAISTFHDPSGSMKFGQLLEMPFVDVYVAYEFGPSWAVHWFKIDAPPYNHNYLIKWETGCEGLLFDASGVVIAGLSDERRFIHVSKNGGTFFIQITCNGMFGNGAGSIIAPPSPSTSFTIKCCKALQIDKKVEETIRSLQILIDIYTVLPENLPARNEALTVANSIVNKPEDTLFDNFCKKHSYQIPYNIYAVGNCHIDTAWLWDIGQTRKKTARSWSSQLQLLEMFPKYIFVCSQMQQLDWLRVDYPELFERIQIAAQSGRFIPLGGCWVEMDGNMPSGESIVRQFFYGQRFSEEYFKIKHSIFWLPGTFLMGKLLDTFGYNAQLPQLAIKGGCEYFVSQKLSWNNINTFPNNSFWWKGIVTKTVYF